jgi:DNA-binding MarR family transcriptional regulator
VVEKRRLYFMLNQAQHRLRKFVDREAIQALGVSSPQAGALYFIRAHDGCLQREIAAEFGQHESAVTGMLGRLEDGGYIERGASEVDSRARNVFITEKGREALIAADRLLADLNRRLTKGFTKAEIDTIARFLESIVTRIGDESF